MNVDRELSVRVVATPQGWHVYDDGNYAGCYGDAEAAEAKCRDIIAGMFVDIEGELEEEGE